MADKTDAGTALARVHGIRLKADGGDIICSGPKLPREIIELLRRNKPGVLELLQIERLGRHFNCRASPTRFDVAMLGASIELRRLEATLLRAVPIIRDGDEIGHFLEQLADGVGKVALDLETSADDFARREIA